MQVGRHPEPVAAMMRRNLLVMHFGVGANLAQHAHATTDECVRLQHVVAIGIDQLPELVQSDVILRPRNREIGCRRQFPDAVEVVARQRLFQPGHAQRIQFP